MAWFGKFALGGLSGLAMSVVVGLPVVHYAENGGLSAIGDDSRWVAASVQNFMRDNIGIDDGEAVPVSAERVAALETEPKPQAVPASDEEPRGLAPGLISGFMDSLVGTAMGQNEMPSIQMRPGESSEEAFTRTMQEYKPLLDLVASQGATMNPLAKNILGPKIDETCNPEKLANISAQNKALQSISCDNIQAMMDGTFDFEAALSGKMTPEILAKLMGGAAIPSRRKDDDLQTAKWKVAAAPAQTEEAAVKSASRYPVPVRRPTILKEAQSETFVAEAKPGPNWSRLPKKVRDLGPQKVWEKCQKPLPDDMPEMAKMLSRQICADAFN